MADVAVGDIVRINVNMDYRSQNYENVHHFKVIDNNTSDDSEFMVQTEAILEAIYNDLFFMQSVLLTMLGIEGQNITEDIILPAKPWVGSAVGIDTDDPLPAQVQGYVFWPTKRPKTRSSLFIPAITEGRNNTLGNWSSAAVTAMQDFADVLLLDIASADVTLRKGAYNRPLDRFTELATARVTADSRTLRNRRIGVGE